MKIHIIARGKIGRSPEAELVQRYVERVSWPVQITELPDRGGKIPPVSGETRIVMLDEHGQQPGSMAFAAMLGEWRDAGVREVRFMIGAADGFTEQERKACDRMIAFGAMTWPHMMARAMLAEQLWRASAILSGHPYHREG